MGPCLCGDPHCGSCGTAQGYRQCDLCGEWSDDGCEHIDNDGEYKPEFQERLNAIWNSEDEQERLLERVMECAGI